MILLINTCGADGMVALMDHMDIVARESFRGGEASEKLIPIMRQMLPRAAPLEAVGVVDGPGSFTGVRVGLAAAKGLCEARGIGLIAMSRLTLLLKQVRADETVALLDAGRDEFFCGFQRIATLAGERILGREALRPLLAGRYLITSEPKVQRSLSPEAEVRLISEPGAHEMGLMAALRIGAGEWSDVATLDANYLRRTDAELLQERP